MADAIPRATPTTTAIRKAMPPRVALAGRPWPMISVTSLSWWVKETPRSPLMALVR